MKFTFIKSSLIALAILGISHSNAQAQNMPTLYLPKNVTTEQVQQEDTEVGWSVHHVVAVREAAIPFLVAKALAKNLGTTSSVAGRLAYAYLLGKNNSARNSIAQVKQLPLHSSAEATVRVFNKYNESGLAQITQDIATCYMPNAEVVALIKEIGDTHTQRFISNMSPKFFELLKTRFVTQYNEFLFNESCMQTGQLGDYTQFGPGDSVAVQNATVTSNLMPDQQFFVDYDNAFNSGTRKIIVTNKVDIIQAANQAGWVGILFDAKNKDAALQLRADLATLGVLKQ